MKFIGPVNGYLSGFDSIAARTLARHQPTLRWVLFIHSSKVALIHFTTTKSANEHNSGSAAHNAAQLSAMHASRQADRQVVG